MSTSAADESRKRHTASPAERPPTYAVAPDDAPVHHEVLEFQQSDVRTALLMLRWASVLGVRTFFQPDEYFQALEPAWTLVHGPAGGAWLTWEWRYQLRTSLHPVLFAGVYAVAETVMGWIHIVGPLRALVLTTAPGVVQAVFAALSDYYVWTLAGRLYGYDSNATWAALWLCVVSPWEWYCGPRTFSNGIEAALTAAALAHFPWQVFGGDGLTAGRLGGLLAKTTLRRLRVALLLAATAVVLRPTNLLIWLALLTVAVTRMTLDGPASPTTAAATAAAQRPPVALLARLAAEVAGCGLLVLAVSAVSDRLYYGEWTLPAYTFLDVNLRQDVAVFYGRNDWHYYLSQGLPLLTTVSLPFALMGICGAPTAAAAAAKAKAKAKASSGPEAAAAILTANTRKALAFAVIATVGALSLVAHKEVRFVYPLLPILQVLAAPHVASFFTEPDRTGSASSSSSSSTPKMNAPPTVLRRKALLAVAVVANVVAAGYLSLFHQPAAVSVLSFLRREYERVHLDWVELPAAAVPAYDAYPDPSWTASAAAATAKHSDGDGDELFALFLTPCHTTPWRSHLVYPGLRARALTCEPPLDTPPHSAARAAYLDETDRFYVSPAAFMATELWPVLETTTTTTTTTTAEAAAADTPRGGEIPRYIVGFENIEDVLQAFFRSDVGAGLGITPRRVWTGWNGFFNEDPHRRGPLVVWDTGVYSNASHPEAR